MAGFEIEIVSHGWLAPGESQGDACSHGSVVVRFDGKEVVTPDDGDFTLSAAALYMLRSLEQDHAFDDTMGNHLLPCCGRVLGPSDDLGNAVIFGCARGIGWRVVHQDGEVCLSQVTKHPGSMLAIEATIPFADYERSVRHFASEVFDLFADAEKDFDDDEERRGYLAYLAEMRRRLA